MSETVFYECEPHAGLNIQTAAERPLNERMQGKVWRLHVKPLSPTRLVTKQRTYQ